MDLGNRIRSRRLSLELTLEEVGRIVGVAKSTVMKWENGSIESMRQDKIALLAKALDVSPLWIMGLDEDQSHYTNRIPLLGRVAAGKPILAEENIEDYFNIDKSVKADFALRVKGDSMIDAEIYNDNIAFIKKQEDLENGEIGVILIDDEATLKRFYKNDGSVILQPENKNYNPIILTKGDVRVLGKLIAVLKQF